MEQAALQKDMIGLSLIVSCDFPRDGLSRKELKLIKWPCLLRSQRPSQFVLLQCGEASARLVLVHISNLCSALGWQLMHSDVTMMLILWISVSCAVCIGLASRPPTVAAVGGLLSLDCILIRLIR